MLNYCYSSTVVHDDSYNKFVLHSAPGTMHHKNEHGENSGPIRICGASGAPVFKVGTSLKLSLPGLVSALSSNGCGSASKAYEMSDGHLRYTRLFHPRGRFDRVLLDLVQPDDLIQPQRGCVPKPRVARHELPWVTARK